jgi:hypothetical protein
VTFPAAGFAFVRGAPERYRSSPPVVRSFCGACGSALCYEHADFPDGVDVTTASLDEPERCPPADQTWTRESLGWLESADRLPRFPRARAEGRAAQEPPDR